LPFHVQKPTGPSIVIVFPAVETLTLGPPTMLIAGPAAPLIVVTPLLAAVACTEPSGKRMPPDVLSMVPATERR